MFALLLATALSAPPTVGEDAPAAKLVTLDGKQTTLKEVRREGRSQVVLMLRGWPGYQCPLCSRQVGDFAGKVKQFDEAGADLVFVYPGPGDGLDKHAREFLGRGELPANARFLLDPDYAMTNAWDLRWDAPRETAYPSTFVVGPDGKVKSATVSNGHAGRTKAADVLASLE